ncbi:MAG: type IV pilus twitching motility protein PilT [Bacillota bacterium]
MEIKKILSEAAVQKASDIHLVFGLPPMIRKDGELAVFMSSTGQALPAVADIDLDQAMKSLLDLSQRQRFEEDKDLDAAASIDEYRYRLNFSYDRGHIKLAARVVDSHKPTLEEIGMPESVRHLLDLPQGLILVTGPTGCGKSATLAAMINHINQERSCHIITLEDPIEYLFTSDKSVISQRQLGEDMVSFSEGLKHCLRQDPDVIMVGEMRDLETISTAITLAETGHLVLATLHTFNSAQTIDRIIDTFPADQQSQIRSQLSMILAGVISQRLLARQSGGRIAAREVMLKNSAISNLIRENKIAQIKTVLETNIQNGMTTLDRHLKQLYQAGEISKETALEYIEEASFLES